MKNLYTKLIQLSILKALMAVLLILSVSHESKASHAAGADLTYRWLSGNTFEVTAAFYRDCGGIDRPNTLTLRYQSTACNSNINTTATMPLINNGPVITYPCASATTTCQGGITPGIQQWIYRTNITLPFACTDWKLSYEVLARNCAITTIVQPSPCNSSTSYEPIYVEALLNNVNAPTNSSPTFSNVPISFICLGQDFNYNHGVLDVDADSLVYSVITPLTSTNTTVSYLPGFSATSPISSSPAFSINTVTGDLFMHSTALQVSIVAVKVMEYRNGVLIGSVIRDMQIYSRNCTPNVVPAASGIDGTNNFTAYVCPGNNICFNITSSDPNPGDAVTMTWNSGVPGATFNISGSPYPTGQFCWTPLPSDARDQPYTFTVTVRDNACPLNGLQTFSYSVYVPNVGADMISSDFSGYGVSCNGDANGSLLADPNGGILPFTYEWAGGETSATINGLDAGSYTVTVTDSKGCSKTVSGVITEPDVLVASANATQDATCGLSNGSATASAVGGAGGNEYLWSDNQTTQIATGLAAGTYTVTVTDDNGCSSEAQVVIANVGDPYFTQEAVSICLGASYVLPDGSIVSTADTYQSNLQTVNGCDSIIVTVLTVNDVITNNVNASICDGDSYLLPDGSSVSVADVYNTLLVSTSGCDSLVITTLVVNPVYASSENVSICSGTSYVLPNGQSVSIQGEYTSELTSVAGCDSVITTNLTVNPVITENVDAAICEGDLYLLPDGSSVSVADVYNTMLISEAGCDSLVVTTLVVNPVYASVEDVAICSGSSYVLPNGQSVSAEGQYISELTSVAGCDSVITTNLTVNEVITENVEAAICEGDSYLLPDGSSVSVADVYNTMLVSAAGCDSLVVTTLVVNPVYASVEDVSICSGSSYVLPNGQSVSVEGQYISELTSVAGCDSVITTNLTVNEVITENVDAAICEGESYLLPDGSSVSVADVYNTMLVSVAGCDSLVVTTLVVNSVYESVESVEICFGTFYTLPNGQTVTEPGQYISTLQSVSGCDSIITSNVSYIVADVPTVSASGPLSFCPGGSVTLTSSPAASYQWLKNGAVINGATLQSYTATTSGNYKVRVSTPCGNRTSSSNIVVKNPLPVVTLSPAGLVKICSYNTLLITANVSGNDPVSYQWYRNNVLIQGATNSTYNASQNGNYKVLVTNTITGCQRLSAKTTVSKVNFTAVLTHDNPLVTCDVDITFTLTTNAGPGSTYVWKRNNVVLQNVTGLTYTTKIAGTYKVLITDENGCTKHSNAFTVIVDCKKDKDKREMAPNYDIYPNPTSGVVYVVKSEGVMTDVSAELYDLSGRVVLTLDKQSGASDSEMKFDTQNLSRGIYFLRINDGGYISAQKIVVE